ncbi:MAG: cation transporter, partial [Actinomycetota bacterium]
METSNRDQLLRMARALEGATLAWNVAGVVVLVVAALKAHSAALGGFGLDSAIEIVASAVVLYELGGIDAARQKRKLRLIGWAFAALAGYLAIQS